MAAVRIRPNPCSRNPSHCIKARSRNRYTPPGAKHRRKTCWLNVNNCGCTPQMSITSGLPGPQYGPGFLTFENGTGKRTYQPGKSGAYHKDDQQGPEGLL